MKKLLMIIALSTSFLSVLNAQSTEQRSKHVRTVGFLIGSSLIGIDYEHRLNDNVGIQAGFGLIGYDLAINWHFNPTVEGSYASLAFKDVGFGVLRTFGPEYCTRWMFGETQSWGITAQIGIGAVAYIDPTFEKDYLKDQDLEKFPSVLLTYGIGISF